MVYLFIYFLKKRNIEALSCWVHWMDVARTRVLPFGWVGSLNFCGIFG